MVHLLNGQEAIIFFHCSTIRAVAMSAFSAMVSVGSPHFLQTFRLSHGVERVCVCIHGYPVGGALHAGGGEGARVRLSLAPQGAVQTLLVVLLLDRVPVYVQHDAG